MARQVTSASRIMGPSASLILGGPTYANASAQGGGSNGALTPSSTQSTPMSTVTAQPVFTGLSGTLFGLPVTWFFVGIIAIVAWKLFEEKRYGVDTFAKIRVDLTNIIKVGLMAGIFFFVFKTSQRLYPIPGVSAFAAGI